MAEQFEFTPENLKRFENYLSRYDDVESAILPVMHLAQEQHGWLPNFVLEKLASMMKVPVIRFQEVRSFYDMFYDHPTGKNIVQVCTNITCSMFGSREIFKGLLHHYKAENLAPTSDGKYMFQKMECLGACSDAPCMRVNNDYHGHITLESAINSLKQL